MLYSRTENFLAFSGLYLKKATQDLRGNCPRATGALHQLPTEAFLLRLFDKIEQRKTVLCMPLKKVFSILTFTRPFRGAVV
ncbi:MAG: hypothetical protein COB46_07150 [Rhodospirillaceae bacterium]|nr:MAG: hypothetical protein COB46_07150 [Rhodospirillaceae bacterium]